MRAPSTAALLVLASLCFDTRICLAEGQQDPLKDPKSKEKYKAACPAYEQYARFSQYEFEPHERRRQNVDNRIVNRTAKAY